MAKQHKPPPNLGVIMAALRWVESGSPAGNYTEPNGQGAYQILQSNWPTWAAQYADYHTSDPNASHAPKAVQDRVAAGKLTEYYYGAGEKNWRLVARIWNGGTPTPVPNPALCAGCTTDDYADRVLERANTIKAGTVDVDTSAPTSTDSSGVTDPGLNASVGCVHTVAIWKLHFCADKIVASGAMGAGGFLILAGVAVFVVATLERTKAGAAARQSLNAVTPAGAAVRAVSRAPARRREAKQAEADSQARRDAAISAERRRQESHDARMIAARRRASTTTRPGIETNPRPRPRTGRSTSQAIRDSHRRTQARGRGPTAAEAGAPF